MSNELINLCSNATITIMRNNNNNYDMNLEDNIRIIKTVFQICSFKKPFGIPVFRYWYRFNPYTGISCIFLLSLDTLYAPKAAITG